MHTEEKEKLSAMIAELGLTMTADFVPFSQSRNKAEKTKSVNWRVTISAPNSRSITTDYMQGVGLLPAPLNDIRVSRTKDGQSAIADAVETGKYSTKLGYVFRKPIPAPSITDVLHSLVLDASAIDAGTFEEWAAEFGYDTDSRSAESSYRACLDIGLKLRAMIGDANLQRLREAFQDY